MKEIDKNAGVSTKDEKCIKEIKSWSEDNIPKKVVFEGLKSKTVSEVIFKLHKILDSNNSKGFFSSIFSCFSAPEETRPKEISFKNCELEDKHIHSLFGEIRRTHLKLERLCLTTKDNENHGLLNKAIKSNVDTHPNPFEKLKTLETNFVNEENLIKIRKKGLKLMELDISNHHQLSEEAALKNFSDRFPDRNGKLSVCIGNHTPIAHNLNFSSRDKFTFVKNFAEKSKDASCCLGL